MWRTETRYVCVLHMDTITKELSYTTTGVIKTSKRNFYLVLQTVKFETLLIVTSRAKLIRPGQRQRCDGIIENVRDEVIGQ